MTGVRGGGVIRDGDGRARLGERHGLRDRGGRQTRADVGDQGTDRVGFGVDEDHGGTGDDRIALSLDYVAVERLRVGGDPDGDGAVDAWWDDALIEGEGDRDGQATSQHLACITLCGTHEGEGVRALEKENTCSDIFFWEAYRGASVEGRRAEL